MRKAQAILVWLLLAVAWSSYAWSGPIPSPLQGVSVSATVDKNNRSGIFTYRYRVSNPATNDGQIRQIDIDITQAPSDAVLSREGLVNGPRYLRHSSEDAFQRVPMVPVGLIAPEGWLVGLGFDSQSPPRGFASWGSMEERFRISPGRTLEGFTLTSYGLPGIRDTEILPGIDWDNVPREFSDPEKARQLRDSLVFFTKTVGPKPPPQDFVSIEFLNYLITLVHDSRQAGWIREDGVRQSLLAKLLNGKRKLEAGDTKVAKNILNAFLNEVRATSCQESSCPGNKPLTSEAYALLFFNGQFLSERLP